MKTPEPVKFPCPKCGQRRIELEAPCKQCGWQPGIASKPEPTVAAPYSTSMATLIGLLTFLPIAYVFFFIAFIVLTMMQMDMGETDSVSSSFAFMFVMHAAVMLLSWCLLGFYIYFLVKSDQLKSDQKILWAVLLLLGGMITLPVFWYLYIWKPASEAQ